MTALIFGTYFYTIGQLPYAAMAFILGGSLLGFLIFNHSPAKIFMGDTGSLLIGLFNAILVIRFINIADTPGASFQLNSSPAIGIAILMVPLFDTLRVFALRIFNRRSPFSPDRNHIHHLLLDKGLSHSAVTYTCVSVNLMFIAFAYLCRDWGCTNIILVMVGIASAGTALLFFTKPRTSVFPNGELGSNQQPIATPRVLSFRKKTYVAPEDN
jgi:UDP-N-acetylmuramyl pentapeptide phosphotransferase/UDP-N-acetylglucosamine-1-phosphate transferase